MADAPDKSSKRRTLTPKQAAFVREYLVDHNATRAAIRAGYSEATATTSGPRLLENVGIRLEIEQATAKQAAKVGIKAEEILAELKRLAFSDLGDIFDKTGALKPLHEIPADARRAIAGVEVVQRSMGEDEEPEVVRKVKLWDKTKSLELLGKHLGLYLERVEHSGKLTFEQLVEESFGDGGGK
jgi:phage terminase small subunit